MMAMPLMYSLYTVVGQNNVNTHYYSGSYHMCAGEKTNDAIIFQFSIFSSFNVVYKLCSAVFITSHGANV